MEANRFCQPERKLPVPSVGGVEEAGLVVALAKIAPGVLANPCPCPSTEGPPGSVPREECPAEAISNPAAAVMPD